jgi:uncharacterized protein YjiS (DUF1127 family)
MLFESEWSGEAIAAPVLVADDPEDKMFTGLGHECWNPTDLRLDQSGEDPDRRDLAKTPHGRRWIGLLTSVVGKLRSRMHRRREIRRVNAAWAMVDDRTLKDIGISRLELEYAADVRHWADCVISPML